MVLRVWTLREIRLTMLRLFWVGAQKQFPNRDGNWSPAGQFAPESRRGRTHWNRAGIVRGGDGLVNKDQKLLVKDPATLAKRNSLISAPRRFR